LWTGCAVGKAHHHGLQDIRTTLCALLYSYSGCGCVLIREMDNKRESPGMWINPKSNLVGGVHSSKYGESKSTHNSRFLELADVVLSKDKPAKPKAKAALPVKLRNGSPIFSRIN
jgi:hypothetical protein